MKNQILIASYHRDFPWLRHCLASLHKFSVGFLPPVVSVSAADEVGARAIVAETCPDAVVTVHNEAPEDQGFMRAQLSMMSGDTLCPEADVVWLVGSDCLIGGELRPEPFFENGKPVMLINSYRHLAEFHAATMPWRRGTARILGFDPEFEYMRRLPLLYPRELFDSMRRHVERTHGKPFAQYICQSDKVHGNTSESNVLGAYAHRFMPELYEWVNLDADYAGTMERFPNPLIQFWSHGGLDRPCDRDDKYHGGTTRGKTPRTVIAEVLNA